MLLDTSAVTSLMERRETPLIDMVERLEGPLPRSRFVYGELLHGSGADPGDPARRHTVEMYEALTEWVQHVPSRGLSRLLGQVSALGTQMGTVIGQTDRWIIAEAVDLVADLVTCDVGQGALASAYLRSIGDPVSVILVPG
ncbi:hypothetical protein BH23ACT3_BH23ACT3_17660 [soil metagenome]